MTERLLQSQVLPREIACAVTALFVFQCSSNNGSPRAHSQANLETTQRSDGATLHTVSPTHTLTHTNTSAPRELPKDTHHVKYTNAQENKPTSLPMLTKSNRIVDVSLWCRRLVPARAQVQARCWRGPADVGKREQGEERRLQLLLTPGPLVWPCPAIRRITSRNKWIRTWNRDRQFPLMDDGTRGVAAPGSECGVCVGV